MYLIVGLGNPGEEFNVTPHNIGFAVLDRIVKEREGHWKKVKSVFGEAFSFESAVGNIILLKPQTYMNKSGLAVRSALRFWKIGLENLVVVQDDADIEIGRLKIGYDQSSGGHKGLESIIQALGSQKFSRIRLGVRPSILRQESKKHVKAEKFILHSFSKKQLAIIAEAGKQAVDFLLENGLSKAMSKYNDSNWRFDSASTDQAENNL